MTRQQAEAVLALEKALRQLGRALDDGEQTPVLRAICSRVLAETRDVRHQARQVKEEDGQTRASMPPAVWVSEVDGGPGLAVTRASQDPAQSTRYLRWDMAQELADRLKFAAMCARTEIIPDTDIAAKMHDTIAKCGLGPARPEFTR